MERMKYRKVSRREANCGCASRTDRGLKPKKRGGLLADGKTR
jgi:hypothetical protein